MNKTTQVETAPKSQATNKDKTPIGNVKSIKDAKQRRKEREEQFRNFRINALKRRATRMGLSKEEIDEAIKKLIEQMNAPKEYSILVMLAKNDTAMFKESLAKENIKYAFCGDDFVYINGNQDVLAKIREIAPTSANIHPYAKKMESVLPKKEYTGVKKPSNNSKDKALAAKIERKEKNIRIHRNKKTGKVTKKIVLKTLAKAKKRKPSIVVHMNAKKASKGSKTLKKAA